jgi:hypothetical protein
MAVSTPVRFTPWLFLLPDCHLHWPAMARWVMLFMLMRRDGEAAAVVVWCHGTPWCCDDDYSLEFRAKWTTRDDAGRRRPASSSTAFSVSSNLSEISLRFAEIFPRYFEMSRWGLHVRAWKRWLLTFCVLRIKADGKSHCAKDVTKCQYGVLEDWLFCMGFMRRSIKVTSGPRYKNECGIYIVVSVKKEIVNEIWHNGILLIGSFIFLCKHKWGHIHTVFTVPST